MSRITSQVNYQLLVSIGLSEQEAEIYVELLDKQTARPKQLAHDLKLMRPSVYRSLLSLVDKGFALKLDASPAVFQAVAPKIAVTHFTNSTARKIFDARDMTLQALSLLEPRAHTAVELITGAKQWYQLYSQRTKLAKAEVLVISVGEQVEAKVRQAFREAASRGVKHRFIFHRYSKINEAILKGWLGTGDTQVRHFPDAGYHLVIWDTQELAIVASNPDNPSERSGMFIKSPSLATAMRSYFFTLWDQSLPVTPTSFL